MSAGRAIRLKEFLFPILFSIDEAKREPSAEKIMKNPKMIPLCVVVNPSRL